MRKLNERDFAAFLLGALVGIYGNWLISFFERLHFNLPFDWVFFTLLGLAIAAFVTFSTYIIAAFRDSWHPNVLAGSHIHLTFFCFLFQASFISGEPPITENMVFWVIGTAIFSTIVPIEWVTFRKQNHDLKQRWKNPKIGILNNVEWDATNKEILTYTDVPPEQWAQLFKKAGLDAHLINLSQNLDYYVAILNPYGGAYPETNLRNLSELKKIIAFTGKGGVFVNIADIPTYWAYNKKLERKIDTTQPIFVTSNNHLVSRRLFELTPLMKELGLSILKVSPLPQNFSNFTTQKTNIFSERVAIMESNLQNVIPLNTIVVVGQCTDVECHISYVHVTAFFIAKYGAGDFIFSLIFLHDGKHSQQERDIIKKAIVQSTVVHLKEKIKLITKK
jgi:hypothetical protein